MGKKSPHVAAYIGNSADFAKPILQQLRQAVHAACSDAEETLKWRFPHFMYQGKILCSMAAFKRHCAFGFWHPSMRNAQAASPASEKALGQFGRLTSLEQLPKKAELTRLIRFAMKLIDENVKPAKSASKAKKPVRVPADFQSALAKKKLARQTFADLSPSHQREYLEWITEAKRPETRQKRIETSLQWLTDGKSRNWKYERR